MGNVSYREGDETESIKSNADNYHCNRCSRSFSWKSNLLRHQTTYHRSRRHLCACCHRVFTDPSNLQRHIRSQHLGSRTHACSQCGKAFATSSGLKQHAHIHSSVKPFRCDVCLKAYTQFSNLCRHKRMHSTCRVQVTCYRCGQPLSTVTSLSAHLRSCERKWFPILRSGYYLGATADTQASSRSKPIHNLQENQQSTNIHLEHQDLIPFKLSTTASFETICSVNSSYAPDSANNSEPNPLPLINSSNGYPLRGKTSKRLHLLHEKSKSSSDHCVETDPKNPRSVSYNLTNTELRSASVNETVSAEQSKRAQKDQSVMFPLQRQPASPKLASVCPEPLAMTGMYSANGVLESQSFVCPANPEAKLSAEWYCNKNGFQVMDAAKFQSKMSNVGGADEPLDLRITNKKETTPPLMTEDHKQLTSEKYEADGHVDIQHLDDGHLPKSLSPLQMAWPRTLHPLLFESMYRMHQENLALSLLGATSEHMFTSFPNTYPFLRPLLKENPPFDFSRTPIEHLEKQPHSFFNMPKKSKDRYSCKFCGKIFPRSANLTRHLRTHTGEQPYKCKYCERSFSISSNLQRHVRNIHNKEKPFRCPLCDRCFGQQTNLDRHLKKHETEDHLVPDDAAKHNGSSQSESYFSEIRSFIGKVTESGGGFDKTPNFSGAVGGNFPLSAQSENVQLPGKESPDASQHTRQDKLNNAPKEIDNGDLNHNDQNAESGGSVPLSSFNSHSDLSSRSSDSNQSNASSDLQIADDAREGAPKDQTVEEEEVEMSEDDDKEDVEQDDTQNSSQVSEAPSDESSKENSETYVKKTPR